MGTDFWVAFMDNNDTYHGSQALSIFVASERACNLTITNPNTGWSQNMAVLPNTNNRFFIPLAEGQTTVSGQITNTGLHVTSTDTISLFAITLGNNSGDYTNVLPTEMLGYDYMVQTYPVDRYSSEFTVVATEDTTIIDIWLHGDASDGHTSGQSFSVTLPNAGSAYQLKSTIPGDLSGTRITARDFKKIAVFNGDACAYIPNWNIGQSCDHLVEQAIPTQYWGNEFIFPTSQSQRSDYLRITSLEDNCFVTINNQLIRQLNSGETFEYNIPTNIAVGHVQTSRPSLVYLYYPSLNANGYGDPSMVTVAPVEQSMYHCRFPVITTQNVVQHYALVVCRTANTSNIRLDGNYVTSSFNVVPSAQEYAYARIPIQEGIHSITAPDTSGYIAYITGRGVRISYGYCLGYACKDLRKPSLLADGVNVDFTPDGLDRCADDSVLFSPFCADSIIYVRWLLNGATYSTNRSLNHCFHDTGSFSICALVNYIKTDDPTIYHDTLCTTVRVHPNKQRHIDDTCVENQLPFILWTHRYYSDTLDTLRFHTVHGCDSSIFFSLKVWNNDTLSLDTVVCDTLLPFIWHGIPFTHDTSFTLQLTNQHNADSIVTFTFDTVSCRPNITYFDTVVCDSLLPYTWHGITFFSDSSVTMRYSASDDSDSIVVHTLYTTICRRPLPDDSLFIWVPNVFTPGRDDNNRFRIFCSDNVTEATVAIYQHWGDFVTRFDGLSESWDGTYKGTPCQQGTYVYLVTYRIGASRKMRNLFGSVTLLR